MTQEDKEWLESEFQKINEGISAAITMAGTADASLRAVRDMICRARKHPDCSGDALYKEFWDRFGEYCQTIETEPERVREQHVGRLDNDARIRAGLPPKNQ
jgi:hypothetical protein